MIKAFDRQTCIKISNEIMDLISPLEKKYGIKFIRKAGRFSEGEWNFKTQAVLLDPTGAPATPEKDHFIKHARIFGFAPEALNKSFDFRGTKYIIVGMKPGSRKFPIIAMREWDKKKFKFPADIVRDALKSKI